VNSENSMVHLVDRVILTNEPFLLSFGRKNNLTKPADGEGLGLPKSTPKIIHTHLDLYYPYPIKMGITQ
jgi:hypothetical protein